MGRIVSNDSSTLGLVVKIVLAILVILISVGIGTTMSSVTDNRKGVEEAKASDRIIDKRIDSIAVAVNVKFTELISAYRNDMNAMAARQDTFMVRITAEQQYNREKLNDIDQTLREIKHNLGKP